MHEVYRKKVYFATVLCLPLPVDVGVECTTIAIEHVIFVIGDDGLSKRNIQ